MPELLANMNPQQREGILSVDGPVLLLAGAGSGKTRVITHRIAYLIQERGVSPDSILAVTFTNKAAKEMAERVERILGHTTLAQPTLATFHSFCVRVLRRDIETLRIGDKGLTRTFAIYDETDQQAVVKAAIKRLGFDDKQLKPRVALGRISWAKNHMIDPQEYFLASTNPMEERIAHIFKIYRDELFKANALASTTCCSKPSACLNPPARSASATTAATSTSSATSTRTLPGASMTMDESDDRPPAVNGVGGVALRVVSKTA